MCVQNIRGRSRRPSPFLLKDHSWFNSTIKVSGPVGAALPPFGVCRCAVVECCFVSFARPARDGVGHFGLGDSAYFRRVCPHGLLFVVMSCVYRLLAESRHFVFRRLPPGGDIRVVVDGRLAVFQSFLLDDRGSVCEIVFAV